MNVMRVDQENKLVQVEILKEELEAPLTTREGTALVEFEVAGSEEWAKDTPGSIALRVANYIVNSRFPIAELTIKVGAPWVVKMVISLEAVLFPDGLPVNNENVNGVIKEG